MIIKICSATTGISLEQREYAEGGRSDMPLFELATLVAITPLFLAWVFTGDTTFGWLLGIVYLLHVSKKILWARK